MISRRQLITGLAAGAGRAADPWSMYGEAVSSGRAAGTSRVPKLKISVIKAARLNGLNRGFVRVYEELRSGQA